MGMNAYVKVPNYLKFEVFSLRPFIFSSNKYFAISSMIWGYRFLIAENSAPMETTGLSIISSLVFQKSCLISDTFSLLPIVKISVSKFQASLGV